MNWWRIFYFTIGICLLVVGVQDMSWIKIVIGIIFLYLGILARGKPKIVRHQYYE